MVGVVTLVVAGSLTAWVLRGETGGAGPRSIAVLPFVDLSAAGDQRYFSDGLTEELTIALSRVEGLQVAARTAAFQFAGAGADLVDVARRLTCCAATISCARRTPDDVRRAIASYEAAARACRSRFATPLFRQAYALLIYADWGWSHPERTAEEMLQRAAALIDAGLVLEPAAAEGWLARAYLNARRDPFAMESALAAFERWLSLDATNAESSHQYGQTLMVLGRYDDAVAAYHRALRAEPHRSMTLVPLAAIALQRGRTDEALRWADSALSIDLANSYARASRARIHLASGDVERGAAAEVAAGVGTAHAIPVTATLAAALAHGNATSAARAAFDEALGIAGPDTLSVVDAPYLAMAAAALGNEEQAVMLLGRARPKGAWFWFYLQTPLLNPLRSDPRLQQMVAAADPRRRPAPTP